MLTFLAGVGVGLLLAAIIGLLVWRNNKASWAKVVDKILAFIDQYDDINALKAALQKLADSLRK